VGERRGKKMKSNACRCECEIGPVVIRTRAGRVGIYASEKGLTRIVLGEKARGSRERNEVLKKARKELGAYFSGKQVRFTVPVDLGCATEFRVRVWRKLRNMPYGQTVSYGTLARMCGRPRSSRAIGGAVGANPLPVVIPCHRVIAADGSLGGFAGGLKWKKFLLRLEAGL
jgi:methylated-DNA-[protein]-cysteine S-methyltransferase